METIFTIGDAELEVVRYGSGPPLLLLESEDQLERDLPLAQQLASQFEVFIPSPPGFGKSSRPDWITSPDDISYLYNDLLSLLDLRDVCVVGFSLGGWLAAEMATKNSSRLSKLVLVDAYGVKHGGPYERDIADIWTLDSPEVSRRMWANPEKGKRDYASMADEKLEIIARNRESLARFCWAPYMHNPKLKKRLHSIDIPTELIWGAQDGIVDTAYGKCYANAITCAGIAVIENAGHFPHVEQPEEFMRVLRKALA
jgi:pimeloyl-ACP methyl ester carboxylesterase